LSEGDCRAHGATLAAMPELPEVETVRARLEPKLVGRRFEHVGIFDPRLTRPADPAGVAAELEGERVAALDRRGKYLIVRFESGRVLLIHLRMTGQLLHTNGGPPPAEDVHRRAVVRLDDGSDVVALHRGIRAALRAGIARQGATLSSYRTPDGSPGRMQEEFRVYGREGEPCERCGTPIEKIRAGGRGTWYCPSCQR